MHEKALVDVRLDGPTAVLTFDRDEKLNAISTDVEVELGQALDSPQVAGSRCIVFTGSGRSFSAGADLSEARDESLAGIEAYYRGSGAVYERIARLPQPSICAIHGYCLGGGLELALATDFRIADESAIFGLPEVELGILPSSGGAHRLVRLVGAARAKELMLIRPRFTASEALAYNVVTEVVAAGNAVGRALELGARIAELPEPAVSAIKASADLMAESSRETSVLVERIAYAALAQTDEARAAGERWARRRSEPGPE
jgi:enoyl-CoA hydratase/carnithine racemase